MTVLTKSDILQGIKNPKKIKIEALNGELWLRPLSSSEVDEILNTEAQGYGTFNATSKRGKTMTDGKMNLPKLQEKQAEAKYLAIYKSINNQKNNDEWEIDEIKQFRNDAVNEIYDHVMELSGVDTTERDVKEFLEDE
jgi:hypothetical protein